MVERTSQFFNFLDPFPDVLFVFGNKFVPTARVDKVASARYQAGVSIPQKFLVRNVSFGGPLVDPCSADDDAVQPNTSSSAFHLRVSAFRCPLSVGCTMDFSGCSVMWSWWRLIQW